MHTTSNKTVLTLFLMTAIATGVWARPGHPGPCRPVVAPRCEHKRPSWGWGIGFSPYGTTVSVGTRIGHHGAIGVTLPLYTPPPEPPRQKVIRETIIVQPQPVVQQPVIIQQPVVQPPVVQQPVVLPTYVQEDTSKAKTWVEGYWVATRNLNGQEIKRTWVPGHWE